MKGRGEKGGRREGEEGREVKGGVEEEKWREREKREGEKLYATQLACKM